MADSDQHDQRLNDIGLILRDLLKVIKVVSMYPADNPLPQSMRRSFAEKLVSLIQEYGLFTISVEKETLSLANEIIFQDKSKEEKLAGLFFQAGITDFTFKEELDVEDVYRLLDGIKDHINLPQHSQDLASRLWELGINGFSFSTLEDISLSEYDESFNVREYLESSRSRRSTGPKDPGDLGGAYESIFSFPGEAEQGGADVCPETDGDHDIEAAGEKPAGRAAFYGFEGSEGSGTVLDDQSIDSESLRTADAVRAMGFDDLLPGEPPPPDTTLILNEESRLSEEEKTETDRLVDDDARFDMYESTVEILREMLHQETEMEGFNESVTICEKVLTELLNHGRLVEAARLLHGLKKLEGKVRKERPLWAERLKDACLTAGSRDRLKVLAESLNGHPDIGNIELKQYLDNFGWEALSGITDLLGDFDHRRHREALCDYLTLKGRTHPDIVAKGIYDKRWYVVRNSVSVLARIGDDTSMKFLSQAVGHQEPRVRKEIASALKDSPNVKALEILGKLALDRDPDIRREAITTLTSRCGQAAFDTVVAVINDDQFPELDHHDQTELLRLFSQLGGDTAVGYLGRLILKYNPLGNKTRAFYRRAAFEALSYNRSEKGERLLVKLASSWRPDIRRQAVAALQRRREFMYTGTDNDS